MGYHKIIEANGTIHTLAEDAFITNGVKGHNTSTLHVCYIGGVRNGKAADTRTDAQKASLLHVLKEWRAKYPNAKIQGHRDFPGVKKECPSFNAINEYKDI
jgi:N-acetylmuramoyl-L-alanine amidase